MIARLVAMADAELAQWRAARVAAGQPLPDPVVDSQEALTVEVDGVAVGGALLEYVEDRGARCFVRVLQTTLPRDATGPWSVVLAALETHVRAQGVVVLATAVAPELAGVFAAAGFRATMMSIGKRLDPDRVDELQEDRRVACRPMTDEERHRYVVEVRELLLAGMDRAGVAERGSARLADLDTRLERVAQDPPPADEMLLTGTVDGVPVGRAWGTVVPRDGGVDFLGHSLDLLPEHRGRGLTKSFLGALRRHVHEVGVRDVHLRVYGHAADAQQTFLAVGAGIGDVHLRKDLAQR